MALSKELAVYALVSANFSVQIEDDQEYLLQLSVSKSGKSVVNILADLKNEFDFDSGAELVTFVRKEMVRAREYEDYLQTKHQ